MSIKNDALDKALNNLRKFGKENKITEKKIEKAIKEFRKNQND